MSYKEQLLLNCLPREDDVISIWTDPEQTEMECNHYNGTDSDYILIAGVNETQVREIMFEVERRKEEFVSFYRSRFPHNAWEVRAKPIILVESLADELAFLRLMEGLDEGDQSEVLSEIQLALNEPWGKVMKVTPEVWRQIQEIWGNTSDSPVDFDEIK